MEQTYRRPTRRQLRALDPSRQLWWYDYADLWLSHPLGRVHGMIADFTLDQSPWHRHYRYQHIRSLTPTVLETVAWTVYFPGFRALSCLRLARKVLTCGRLQGLPGPLRGLAKRLSRCESKLGDQLVILFRKRTHG